VEPFGFFPYRAKATVVQKDLSCRPCSAHGSAACPLKHHRCLQDLMPEDVLEALRRLPR
jgi:heptosyltransferase-2